MTVYTEESSMGTILTVESAKDDYVAKVILTETMTVTEVGNLLQELGNVIIKDNK